MNILGTAVKGTKAQTNLIGAPSFSKVNPYGMYGHFHSDAYASAYPSIRAIANEYMGIRPYAIDQNGKTVDNNPIINALYHPNQLDSSVSFFEKIAVSTLALAKTYVLVWRNENGEAKPGGNFGLRGAKIAGFTFLEGPAISIRDGKTYYNVGSQQFTEDEVMVLPGGVDPYNLYAGYSPSIAAKRWATLDDYIADFQKGFFENGAVPAGQFIITAASQQDFEDTKKTMQDKHRGAGNNNNIAYVPRPMGQDGKPADAKIEWIPFGQSNKDIDFKNLFEQTNKRIDLAFGVPQIVKGVDDAATYANAQVAAAGFSKRAVYPLALRNYTQITHELNRITGGIGVAITFQYDIPTVSDEEKVEAETKVLEGTLINTMIAQGFTLDSIIDSFKLSTAYKNLKLGDAAETIINNDKPDVDEGNEVDDSPDPTLIDGVTPLAKKGEAKGKSPKAKLSDEEKLKKATRDYMRSQVDRAVYEYKDTPLAQSEPTQDELDTFVESMMATISGILAIYGKDEYAAAVALAGLDLSDLQGFTLTDITEDTYKTYIRQVGTNYGSDTAASIQKVLLDSRDLGWTRKQTEDALHNIMDTDDYRVERLARTELNRSQAMGQLEGVKSLAAETNTHWEKTINHSGVTPCPLCASQEGVWTPLDEPIWSEGDTITTQNSQGDTVIYVNDWQTNDGWDYHANGRGTPIFRRALA